MKKLRLHEPEGLLGRTVLSVVSLSPEESGVGGRGVYGSLSGSASQFCTFCPLSIPWGGLGDLGDLLFPGPMI